MAALATGHVHESHNLGLASKIEFVALRLTQQGLPNHVSQLAIISAGSHRCTQI